ncbi:hypothetical protein QQP08_004294 [Theobroma cacao]|nr:hypothetical protein QQP08_004294 [Theobroma cacao]
MFSMFCVKNGYLNFVLLVLESFELELSAVISKDLALEKYGKGGAVSPEGDIYSYGILLLEMITGRRPTDAMFHGGLNLHNFCNMALPERLKEILDSRLLEQICENNERSRSQPNMEAKMLESLVSFAKVGVACSAEAPGERMGIKDAITELLATKARLLRTGIHGRDRR